MSDLKSTGRVGMPRSGEERCPSCNGAGRVPGNGLMGGCDCGAGTGVVVALRIGDKVPMPERRLVIRPNAPIDNRPTFTPSRGPKK